MAASPTPIVDWLLGDAKALPDQAELLAGLSERLRAAGVPLWRTTFHLPQLHPQMRGEMHVWRSDADRVESEAIARQIPRFLAFHHSPVALLNRSRAPVRRRLVEGGRTADVDFPILEELQTEGGTDYALLPMPLSNDRVAGFGMTTRAPEGFRPDQMALVEAILPALTVVLELKLERATIGSLLTTYVGREAARRILAGQVTLTAGHPIRAVIFFCDLRDFTGLSETLPRRELLTLLNGYFGCIVGAVHGRDGEVLKFLGDGLLAIFRLDEGEATDIASAKAIMASFEAVTGLERLNADRRAAGKVEARCGIALHVGSVLYGNIGAEDRLDFTVIGPTVNKASRLEDLCAQLGETILTSKEFASASPVRLRSLGRHRLKGLSEPQEVFAPDMSGGLDEQTR